MKGKERAALRKQANTLAPIFQIGKGDIGDAMIEAIDAALQKRELIKISVLETSGLTARDAAEVLSVATGADVNASDSDYGMYVAGINGLAGGDFGDMSGWMFEVNGEMAEVGCSQLEVADGDVITWTYVTEFTE